MWAFAKDNKFIVLVISVLILEQFFDMVIANCLDDQLEDAARTSPSSLQCCEQTTLKTIPASIGFFSDLNSIDLGFCFISGTLPSGIFTLEKLTNLNLYENQVTGSISSALGDLINLEFLFLYENKFTGHIPSEVGQLTGLVGLGFHKNQLNGTIPSQLGNLVNIYQLGLNDNALEGTVPSELGGLVGVNLMYLARNLLTGPIPSQLAELINLEYIELQQNRLEGHVPKELGNLASLKQLDFHENELSGPIPSQLAKLGGLKFLDLRENQFTGPVPSELGLMYLGQLYLSENKLTGAIPSELGKLTGLDLLYLEQNQLSGPVPSELGQLTRLKQLFLHSNQFTSAIPSAAILGLGSDLKFTAYDNPLLDTRLTFGESRPSDLRSLGSTNSFRSTDQWRVELNRESFTKALDDISEATDLTVLHLGNTFNGGTIPESIRKFWYLAELDIRNNSLTGTLPIQMNKLTYLNILNLHGNFIKERDDDLVSNVMKMICAAGTHDRFDPDEMGGRLASERCAPCQAGTYQPYIGQLQCEPCPDGQYQPGLRKTECEPCDNNRAVNDLRTECESCPRNTQLNIITGNCDACGDSTPVSIQGSICTACPPRELFDPLKGSCESCTAPKAFHEASSTCQPCALPTVFNNTDLACHPCQDETVYSTEDKSCKPCAFGTAFEALTKTCQPCPFPTIFDLTDQICKPCVEGTVYDAQDRSCKPCSANSYINDNGKCEKCDKGLVTVAPVLVGENACVAPAEFYRNSSSTILACPVGTQCDKPGTTLQTLVLKPGFWRPSVNSSEVYACPGATNVCVGTAPSNSKENATVTEPHQCLGNRTGVFCGSCAQDFVPRGKDDTCTYCDSAAQAEDRSSSAVIVSVAVILFCCGMGLAMFLFVRFGQAGAMSADEDNTTSKFANLIKYGKAVCPFVTVCRDLLTCKLRIILGYMQVISAWTILFVNGFPLPAVIDSSVAARNADLSMFPESFGESFQPMSYLTLDIWSSIDAGCALPRGHEARLVSASSVPIALVLLILFVLGGYSVVLMHAKSARKGGGVLFARIRTVGLTGILFVLFLVYPSVSRVVFQTFDCVEVGDASVLRSDVTVSCKSERYDWMLDLAKAMVVLFVVGVPMLQVCMLWFRVEVPFLTKHYLPQYRWFQLEELGVKLFQTTIVVVAFRGSRLLQSVYLLFVTVISLCVVIYMLPYRIYWDNILAVLVQCALAALIGLGLVHSQDEGSRDQVAGLMLFTVSVPFVVALGLACFEIWQWKKTGNNYDEDVFAKAPLTWEETAALKRVRTMLTDETRDGSGLKTHTVSRHLLKSLGTGDGERIEVNSIPEEVENSGQVLRGELEWQDDVSEVDGVRLPELCVADEIATVHKT